MRRAIDGYDALWGRLLMNGRPLPAGIERRNDRLAEAQTQRPFARCVPTTPVGRQNVNNSGPALPAGAGGPA